MDLKGYQERLDRLKSTELTKTLDYMQVCFGRHSHVLDLSNHYLLERAVRKLCRRLSSATVKVLVLKNCLVTQKTLTKVLAALKPGLLSTLDIANNRLVMTADLGSVLGQFLSLSRKPKSLVLQGNVVEEAAALNSFFSFNFALKELNLYDTNLSEDALVALARALANNLNVKSLNLGFNSEAFASGKVVKRFAASVAQNQYLEVLNVSGNDTISSFFEVFCEELASNRTLQVLTMASVGIGDEGIELLLNLLRKAPITGLDLQNNEISAEGVAALMQGIPPTVAFLDISYNEIRDSGAILSISGQLMESRSLRRLNMSHTLELENLDERILERLCEALLKNDSLTEFYCEGVKISDNPDAFCRMINEAIAMRKLSLTYKISAVNCYPNSQSGSILRNMSGSAEKIISDIPSSLSSHESKTETEHREFMKEDDENANTSRQYLCPTGNSF